MTAYTRVVVKHVKRNNCFERVLPDKIGTTSDKVLWGCQRDVKDGFQVSNVQLDT